MFRIGIRISSIALMVLSTITAAEDEPASGERLLVPIPDGWEKSFHDREGQIGRADYLPIGQNSVESDEMISAQIMYGLTEVKPEQVLGRLADEAEKACEAFDAQPLQMGDDSTYASLGIMVMCGSNSNTSRGELILVRAIAGRHNFYLVQKIWKTSAYGVTTDIPVPFDERKRWLDFLASISVCDLTRKNCPDNIKK